MGLCALPAPLGAPRLLPPLHCMDSFCHSDSVQGQVTGHVSLHPGPRDSVLSPVGGAWTAGGTYSTPALFKSCS